MIDRDALFAEPFRFDFFTVMRDLERNAPGKPRVGDSASRDQEVALLGQDPYLDFPASTIARADHDKQDRLRLFVKFLGLLGPQGALPLSTTDEVYGWTWRNDDSFARFADIVNHRFLQLFFRAWADSRPVAQFDRPSDDRFQAYVGAPIGLGSTPYRNLDSVPDAAKLSFAGLMGPKVRSAARLEQLVRGVFGVETRVEQFVGMQLMLEREDRTTLGRRHSRLGVDALVGASVYSVEDKIRIRLYTRDLAQYCRFLPRGDLCLPLADLVFFYLGAELDFEAELAIPAGAVQPIRLGSFGQLGWTTWVAPAWSDADAAIRADARFHPAERRGEAAAAAQPQRG